MASEMSGSRFGMHRVTRFEDPDESDEGEKGCGDEQGHRAGHSRFTNVETITR
jgi:hypothetical protein